MGISEAQILCDVVGSDLSAHPRQSEEGTEYAAECDTLLPVRVEDGPGANRVACEPEDLLELVPDRQRKCTREVAQAGWPSRCPVFGQPLQVGVTVHQDHKAVCLERGLEALSVCCEHALCQDSGWGGDKRLVVRATVCDAHRELHYLISVRCTPAEMNDAGYSAQVASRVAGVYRADSG